MASHDRNGHGLRHHDVARAKTTSAIVNEVLWKRLCQHVRCVIQSQRELGMVAVCRKEDEAD
jgi:hypothetical protein